MKLTAKPKLLTLLLVGGTSVLVGGGVAAATLPSNAHETATAMAPQQSRIARPAPVLGVDPGVAQPSVAPRVTVRPPSVQPGVLVAPTTTYVVKKGDNLTEIAAWFRLHGYGSLFAQNKHVIGADPNLIKPGERIIVTSGVMSMQSPS